MHIRIPSSATTRGYEPRRVFAALLAAGMFTVPALPAQDLQSRLTVDQRRVEAFASDRQRPGPRSEQMASAMDVMRQGLQTRLEGEAPVMLVMFTVRIQGGERVVATHRSEPFQARPGGVVPCCPEVLPGLMKVPDAVGPHDIVAAERALPANYGVRPAGALASIVDGVFPNKPTDWQRREIVYIFVAPRDPELRERATGYPLALFLTTNRGSR